MLYSLVNLEFAFTKHVTQQETQRLRKHSMNERIGR